MLCKRIIVNMSKLYDQYVLINSSVYKKYEHIIEERMSELDHNLVSVVIDSSLSQKDKIEKLLSFSEEYRKNDDLVKTDNKIDSADTSAEINPQTGDDKLTDTNFEHLASCFNKERSDQLSSENNSSIPDHAVNPSHSISNSNTGKNADKNSSEPPPPRKRSILDSSRILKKEKLISDEESKKSKSGNPIRRSGRTKNPISWSKYK